MTAQPKLILGAGGAEILIKFAAKVAAPQRRFDGLVWEGRPYPEALFRRVLEPFLLRWRRGSGDRRPELRASLEAAMDQCLAAFQACAPERAQNEDRAVLAALTVTANLQRTLLRLGDELARPRSGRQRRATVVLSREWCGLAVKPGRPIPGATDHFRPLGRALGCTSGEIESRCRAALTALREDFRGGDWLAEEDVEAAARRLPP